MVKQDETKQVQFTVLTDRSQGGSSLAEGEVELMVSLCVCVWVCQYGCVWVCQHVHLGMSVFVCTCVSVCVCVCVCGGGCDGYRL